MDLVHQVSRTRHFSPRTERAYAGWIRRFILFHQKRHRDVGGHRRVGKAKAVTATARKLAILVYRSLKHGLVYQDPGAVAYDLQHKTRVVRRLRQRAAALGFDLVDLTSSAAADGVVS